MADLGASCESFENALKALQEKQQSIAKLHRLSLSYTKALREQAAAKTELENAEKAVNDARPDICPFYEKQCPLHNK